MERFRQYLTGYLKKQLLAMGLGDKDLDDLVQQTLTLALANVNKYRPEMGAGFTTWVISIGRNVVLQYRDEQKKIPVPGGMPGSGEGKALGNEEEYMLSLENMPETDPALLPEEVVLAGDSRLNTALYSLKPRYRQLIQYLIIEGLNPREVARRLGVTENHLRQMKRRAIHRFQQEYLKLGGRQEKEPVQLSLFDQSDP